MVLRISERSTKLSAGRATRPEDLATLRSWPLAMDVIVTSKSFVTVQAVAIKRIKLNPEDDEGIPPGSQL